MRTRYGDLSFKRFGPDAIEDIKAGFVSQPRKANQILALFRILLGYAVKLRLLRDNPALRPEMLATTPRVEVWSRTKCSDFCKDASSSLRLALMLLVYTAQRPGDVLEMTTARITERDGRLYILLRQQKTDELLAVPLHTDLAPLVRERMATRVVRRRKAEDGQVSSASGLECGQTRIDQTAMSNRVMPTVMPTAHQISANPLILARPAGLEPATHSLEGCCSIHLS
jgi:integrase